MKNKRCGVRCAHGFCFVASVALCYAGDGADGAKEALDALRDATTIDLGAPDKNIGIIMGKKLCNGQKWNS